MQFKSCLGCLGGRGSYGEAMSEIVTSVKTNPEFSTDGGLN